MKRLSEVCKEVGVTRRTLQEYDKIDLLNPTDKTESGYWIYDEETIAKLKIIQVYIECGYKRKTIKQILESTSLDPMEECNSLVKMLEKKRKKLDGLINFVKMIQMIIDLPVETLIAFNEDEEPIDFNNKQNFREIFYKIIDIMSQTFIDDQIIFEYMPFYIHLISIGKLRKKNPGQNIVQKCVRNYYECMKRKVIKVAKDRINNLSDSQLEEMIIIVSKDFIIDNSDVRKRIETNCGSGSTIFIYEAIDVFYSNLKKKRTV